MPLRNIFSNPNPNANPNPNMADQPQETAQRAQAATLPLPPPFYKDFTPARIERYEFLRVAQAERDGTKPQDTRVPNLPEDLINLQPPPPPEDGAWRCFGERYTLDEDLPSLEESGIEQLVPTAGPNASSPDENKLDREIVLKRCAKSLLLNFLELISLLSYDPTAGLEKVQEIRTLFVNFHHALNEYRPHQARESLIAMMQDQLDRARAETRANREAADKARRVLEGLGSIKIPDDKTLFPPIYPNEEGDGLGEDGRDLDPQEEAEIQWQRHAEVWAAL